jgi:hypothetical protein
MLWVGVASAIEAGTFEAAYLRTPTPAQIAAGAHFFYVMGIVFAIWLSRPGALDGD